MASPSHSTFESLENPGFGQGFGLLALAVSSPFILTWIVTAWKSWRLVFASKKAPSGEKRPPTLPTAIPFIGHVFHFMRDGHAFLYNAVRYFEHGIPVRVNLATLDSYIISGRKGIAEFLKDPGRGLNANARSLKIMEHAFGCPHDDVEKYKPLPGTEIEHEINSAMRGFLDGPGLGAIAERYQNYVVDQLLKFRAEEIDDWIELPNVCSFVENQILLGATRAVYGTHAVDVNPDLADDFWNFNRHVKSMFMGVPRWLNGRGFKARDQMTGDIKRWQRYAEEHVNIDEIPDDVQWEPYYGARPTRKRQQLLTKRGILDPSARAAENLAFLWATNANSVPAACWFMLYTLHDPSLKKRVLERLATTRLADESDGRVRFDITKLIEDDLIQSVYAEVLRLRVAVIMVRQPAKDDYSVDGWHIPKGETVAVSTRNELMDESFWNTGSGNAHPVKSFWSDRFLVYPGDPHSGPCKEARRQKTSAGNGDPYFSLDGCTWSWIPYGGGRGLCPGRNFAKREILLSAAALLTMFDIELLTDKIPGPDESVFGFGTMPPAGQVPCRIRRRRE